MEHELGHKAEHLKPKHFSMIDIFPKIEKTLSSYKRLPTYRSLQGSRGLSWGFRCL